MHIAICYILILGVTVLLYDSLFHFIQFISKSNVNCISISTRNCIFTRLYHDNTVNTRFTGLVGRNGLSTARYIGEHGKSVRLLPVLYTKYAFRGKGFTRGKSVVTVNQSAVNRLLTV